MLPLVQSGRIDSTLPITHVLPLSEAPRAFQIFNDKEDGCVKVCDFYLVMKVEIFVYFFVYDFAVLGFLASL